MQTRNIIAVAVAVFGLFLMASAGFAGTGGPELVNLSTVDQWDAAIKAGDILAYPVWDMGFENHYPGKSVDFFKNPLLVAFNGFTTGNITTSRPGIVMEWGTTSNLTSKIAAWQYRFCSGKCICQVCITAIPPPNITEISLGLKDVNGRIMSWAWKVGPGGLPPGQPTRICVDPRLGPGQAGSYSYYVDPGFDFCQITAVIFDENGRWVGQTSPTTNPNKVWNYWSDLVITNCP